MQPAREVKWCIWLLFFCSLDRVKLLCTVGVSKNAIGKVSGWSPERKPWEKRLKRGKISGYLSKIVIR